MKWIFLAVLATATATAAVSSAARQFEDTFGRTIEAELIAHWGSGNDFVKIDKGGKQLTVEVGAFAKKHQEEIRAWMRENPENLAAMIDPPHSGERLITGIRWLYLRGDGSRVSLEFRGAGELMKNGVRSRSGRWTTVDRKYLRFRWGGGGDHVFTKPVIADRLFRDRNSKSVLVKLDRPPARIDAASISGRSFILFNTHTLTGWLGKGASATALVELNKGGEAHFPNTGLTTKWRIEAGHIVLRHSSGKDIPLRPYSRDIYISRPGHVLWEIAPPQRP